MIITPFGVGLFLVGVVAGSVAVSAWLDRRENARRQASLDHEVDTLIVKLNDKLDDAELSYAIASDVRNLRVVRGWAAEVESINARINGDGRRSRRRATIDDLGKLASIFESLTGHTYSRRYES